MLIPVTLAVLAFGVVTLAIQSNGQRLEASYWERHALQVQVSGQTLLATLNQTEADQRTYLLLGDEVYLQAYSRDSDAVRSQLGNLRAITGDNGHQQADIAELSSLIDQRLATLQDGLQRSRAGDRTGAIDLVRRGEGGRSMNAARGLLGQVDAEEQARLSERTAAVQRANSRLELAIVGFAILAAVLVGLAGGASGLALRARDRAQSSKRLERAAAEVKKAHDFLQLVIDRSIDPIFVKDWQGRFVLANDRAAELYGTTKQEMLGKQAEAFLPLPWLKRSRPQTMRS